MSTKMNPTPFRLVEIRRASVLPRGLRFIGLSEVEADLVRFKDILNGPCPFTHTDLENLEKKICAARECLEDLADAYGKVLSRKDAHDAR